MGPSRCERREAGDEKAGREKGKRVELSNFSKIRSQTGFVHLLDYCVLLFLAPFCYKFEKEDRSLPALLSSATVLSSHLALTPRLFIRSLTSPSILTMLSAYAEPPPSVQTLLLRLCHIQLVRRSS